MKVVASGASRGRSVGGSFHECAGHDLRDGRSAVSARTPSHVKLPMAIAPSLADPL
jgi:hypothetical protein